MRTGLVVAALLLVACGDGRGGPRLALDLPGDTLDFGPMRPNEVARKTVSFRNAGDAVLVLEGADTTCACAKASLPDAKREYAPGESGGLVVVLTAPAAAGPLEKRVSVRTNEREPVRSWLLRAEVSLGLVLSASILDFGRHAPGEPATASVQIRSPKGVDWTVLEVRGSALTPEGTRISYPFTLREVEEPSARVVELTVTHPEGFAPGLREDSLTIATSHPDQPSLPVAARLEIAPR
jgi:hypothetical protein